MPEVSKIFQRQVGMSCSAAKPTMALRVCLEVELGGVDTEVATVRRQRLEAGRVDIDRDDRAPRAASDLHAEAADSSDPDEDRQIARLESRAIDRLVRGRDRVGDDRQNFQGRAREDSTSGKPGREPGTSPSTARRRERRSRRGRRCPGRSAADRSSLCPARHASHSPQGITAGTTTSRPSHASAPVAGRSTTVPLTS